MGIRINSRLLLGLLSLLNFAPFAQADLVVMLDINDSAAEVRSLQEVMEQTGESAIIFPSDRATDARRRFLAQQNEYLANVLRNNKGSSQYESLAKQKSEGFAELEQLRSKVRLGENSLEDSSHPRSMNSFLSSLSRTHGDITLIISGHFYTHSHVKGELGQFYFEPLLKLLNSKIGPRVRRLLLWGCYGLNAQKVQTIWRTAFPNLDLAFGFVDTAPLNSTQASHVLLGHVLKHRDELSLSDSEKVVEIVRRNEAASVTYWSVWNSSGYRQTSLVKPTSQATQARCVNEASLASAIDYWEKYQSGKISAVRMPPEDSNHPLRQLYRAMQAARFPCRFMGSERSSSFLHELFGLLYFEHIKRFSVQSWGSQLTDFIQLARSKGVASAGGLLSIESMDRREIVSVLSKVWGEWLGLSPVPSEKEILEANRNLPVWSRWGRNPNLEPSEVRKREERRRDHEALRMGWIEMNATLVSNLERCVPVAWLSGHPAPSPCPLR